MNAIKSTYLLLFLGYERMPHICSRGGGSMAACPHRYLQSLLGTVRLLSSSKYLFTMRLIFQKTSCLWRERTKDKIRRNQLSFPPSHLAFEIRSYPTKFAKSVLNKMAIYFIVCVLLYVKFSI